MYCLLFNVINESQFETCQLIRTCKWNFKFYLGNFTYAPDISCLNNGRFHRLKSTDFSMWSMRWQFETCLLTSSKKIQWQFQCNGRSTRHLVVNAHIDTNFTWTLQYIIHDLKNGKFEMKYPDRLLLTCSCQDWKFHMCYWHLVVKNGNFILLMTC